MLLPRRCAVVAPMLALVLMQSGCSQLNRVSFGPVVAMTEGEASRGGAVIGENRVGMTRAGLSPDERREIKAAFRVIYRAGLGRSAAIEYLSASVSTDAGRRLLEFMAGDSHRGVATRSPNSARAA